MTKFKTEFFEIFPKIRFEVRITHKKMLIDQVNSSEGRKNYIYIEYVKAQPQGRYYKSGGYYIAGKPHSSWRRESDKIDEIIGDIEEDLDMKMPVEAIDMFTSRILADIFIKN